MLALNTSQRRFVIAALTFPTGKDWQIAKAAGYSARSYGALRVAAHRLFHDEKVIEALNEEAGKRLRSSAVLGVSVLAKIARTDGHKHQLRAAEALLNRIGFHEKTEHTVSVSHTDRRGAALEERIRELGDKLGFDVTGFLGRNAPGMKLIEATREAADEAVVAGRDAGSGGDGAAGSGPEGGDGAAGGGGQAEP